MNSKSEDAEYTRLHALLKEARAELAKVIAEKVYKYGFLIE